MSTALATQIETSIALTALVDRASKALAGARSAAEVLEARDMASVAYDAAKKAARLGKAKRAHDDLISAVYRAQADALEIEAQAKRRLADEYDAAQERKEIARPGNPNFSKAEKLPNAKDIVNPGDLHEARIIRDAEEESPGIIRQALDKMLEAGEEPTKARVRRTVLKSSKRKKRPRGSRFEPPQESQHDRDLRALIGMWESACESARKEFLETVS